MSDPDGNSVPRNRYFREASFKVPTAESPPGQIADKYVSLPKHFSSIDLYTVNLEWTSEIRLAIKYDGANVLIHRTGNSSLIQGSPNVSIISDVGKFFGFYQYDLTPRRT